MENYKKFCDFVSSKSGLKNPNVYIDISNRSNGIYFVNVSLYGVSACNSSHSKKNAIEGACSDWVMLFNRRNERFSRFDVRIN